MEKFSTHAPAHRACQRPRALAGLLRSVCVAVALAGCFIQRVSADNITAYDALRLIGNQRDSSYYDRLISISGRDGATQPKRWTLLFFDPNTRYGLREIEVQGGYIVSERTPRDEKLSPIAPQLVLDLQKLNLNSDGAFKIANNAATQARLGFDSLTYVLRKHEVTKSPVWVLDMKDYRRMRVGTMLVNAETGAVIRPPAPGTQHTFDPPPGGSATGGQTPPYQEPDDAGNGGFIGRVSQTFNKAGRETERFFLNVGGTLEEFFTGRRTIPSEP